MDDSQGTVQNAGRGTTFGARNGGGSLGGQGAINLSERPRCREMVCCGQATTGVNLMNCAQGGANRAREAAVCRTAERRPCRSSERGETVPFATTLAAHDRAFSF